MRTVFANHNSQQKEFMTILYTNGHCSYNNKMFHGTLQSNRIRIECFNGFKSFLFMLQQQC